MIIKESAENYLESILMLQRKKGYARSVDVAAQLNFSKASVSVAMKRFRSDGYVEMDAAGNLTLTEKGRQIAEKMFERHEIIARGLIALGVAEDVAYEDSCKIEHDLSDISFQKIKDHLKNKGVIG